MHTIGLTGGIATGKSTVTQYLRNKGYPCLDADQISREVVEPGEVAFEEIVEAFGEEILTPAGRIDRKRLGLIVFNNYAKLSLLNAIVHPQVRMHLKARLEVLRNAGEPLVFFDCPLLYESKLDNLVDRVWVVYTDEATQLQRLMARDHIREPEAMTRISAQMPIEEKRMRADLVLDNDGDVDSLYRQVEAALKNQGA